MKRSSTSGPAAKVRLLVLIGSAAFLWRSPDALALEFSHMLWLTVCEDIYGGSLEYLRFAHCSGGGAYCDVGDYNATDATHDIIFLTIQRLTPISENRTYIGGRLDPEDGFDRALIGPGATYGFAYDLDVDPTTLAILKEPGYDALCLEKVGWQRSNSTEDWDVEESNLLGNSALIYLNEPEFTEDPDSNTGDLCVFDDDDWPYVCDEGQITTCSGGLYTAAGDTTQTEWPCLRGWHFFNLQRDANYEYELKMEGCSGNGDSTGASASFCPDPHCNTSDVVEEALGNFDGGSGATVFPVKLGFNPVAIRLSASAEEGWCANAMSFNGFALAGSYPYEMAANESRIVENIQYFGVESTTSSSSSDGPSSLINNAAWPTAMMTSAALATLQLFAAT